MIHLLKDCLHLQDEALQTLLHTAAIKPQNAASKCCIAIVLSEENFGCVDFTLLTV